MTKLQQLLPVDKVPSVIAEFTRALEESGEISALIATQCNFEAWWQREVMLAFTRPPFNRSIGGRLLDEDDYDFGVAIEQTWEVTDRRLRFCRRNHQDAKRIDVVVRKGATGNTFHLIELKVVSPHTRNIHTLERDFHGLKTMEWDIVSSGWLVALVHGFDTGNEARERLHLIGKKNVVTFQVHTGTTGLKLFVIGHRAI